VLAADSALVGEGDQTVNTLWLAGADLAALQVTPEPATGAYQTWPGARLFRVNAIAREATATLQKGDPTTVRLVPFADAGATGKYYKVWLPLNKP